MSTDRPAACRRALGVALARRLLGVALLLGLAMSCRGGADQTPPELVVQRFIDNMHRVHGDVERARAAYELLARPDRDNLAERARRASAVAGRTVAPEEMLVPSRFHLEFQPKRWSSNVSGKYALVYAHGPEARQQHEIRCVEESDGWKVLLDLPRPPPVERRQLADPADLR